MFGRVDAAAQSIMSSEIYSTYLLAGQHGDPNPRTIFNYRCEDLKYYIVFYNRNFDSLAN